MYSGDVYRRVCLWQVTTLRLRHSEDYWRGSITSATLDVVVIALGNFTQYHFWEHVGGGVDTQSSIFFNSGPTMLFQRLHMSWFHILHRKIGKAMLVLRVRLVCALWRRSS